MGGGTGKRREKGREGSGAGGRVRKAGHKSTDGRLFREAFFTHLPVGMCLSRPEGTINDWKLN